ncbi:MAG: YciI family protein [Proteobacteria bacterium]|nr:YciI family protein [Pseudomonadota bacterium]
MFYVIVGTDADNSLDARLSVRSKHLQRLEQLKEEGRLFVAGPCPAVDSNDPGPAGFTGSVIIAEFPSLHDAELWARADPYVEAGVFKNVLVKPFKKVLP